MSFGFWEEQKLIVVKRANTMPKDTVMSPKIMRAFIADTVHAADIYYPSIQLTLGTDEKPKKAIGMAINTAGQPKHRPN